MAFQIKVYDNGEPADEKEIGDDDWFVLTTGRYYVANQQHFSNGTVNLTLKKDTNDGN